ncbi:hypothetical protein CYMTET_19737 [Cymbomonas tetramitiformis]|uniref:Ubiquitin-like protease family profile domain-containing protein n=1 Tax=Cymbomonas tetramitiformis TaxID=36881 RepID=A0AAE0L4N7_9CHLO|nr:hypothetical protein CYMTET_19737 [Cymbomonas tetramitiformis]
MRGVQALSVVKQLPDSDPGSFAGIREAFKQEMRAKLTNTLLVRGPFAAQAWTYKALKWLKQLLGSDKQHWIVDGSESGIQKAKRKEVEQGNAKGLGLRATGGGPNSEYGVQVSSVENYIAQWVKARDAIHYGPSQHLRIEESETIRSQSVDADLVHQRFGFNDDASHAVLGYLSRTFSDAVHWRAVFVDSENKRVYAFDPYGAGFLDDVFDHLKRAFNDWECTLLNISLQSDGFNCGAWCLLLQQLWLHFVIDSHQDDFRAYALEQLQAMGYQDLQVEPTHHSANQARITEFRRALQADVIKLLDDVDNENVQLVRSDDREANLRGSFKDVIDLTAEDGHTFVSQQFGVPDDVDDIHIEEHGPSSSTTGVGSQHSSPGAQATAQDPSPMATESENNTHDSPKVPDAMPKPSSDSSPAQEPQEDPMEFVGKHVRLTGLSGRGHTYNGREGKCTGWLKDSCRFSVKLNGESTDVFVPKRAVRKVRNHVASDPDENSPTLEDIKEETLRYKKELKKLQRQVIRGCGNGTIGELTDEEAVEYDRIRERIEYLERKVADASGDSCVHLPHHFPENNNSCHPAEDEGVDLSDMRLKAMEKTTYWRLGGDNRKSGKSHTSVTEACLQMIGERGQWSIFSICSWLGGDDYRNWVSHAGSLDSSVLKQIKRLVEENNGEITITSDLGEVKTLHVFITSGDYPVLCALSGEPGLCSQGSTAFLRNIFNNENRMEAAQPFAFFDLETRKCIQSHSGEIICTMYDDACEHGKDGGKCRACWWKEELTLGHFGGRPPVDFAKYDTLESLCKRFGPTWISDVQALNGLEHISHDANLQEVLPEDWVSKYLDVNGVKHSTHRPDGSWARHIVVPRNSLFGRDGGYPNKLTPGGVETISTDVMHSLPNLCKKAIIKAYRRCIDDDLAKINGYSGRKKMFFEKLSSYSINVNESDEVKENGAENDGQREYQKLNGRFDYVPMEKFIRHHREILGPVQMDEETLERWCRLLNAIYQKNKLVQKRNMTDEEKIDCARWATRALIACHEVWYEADVSVYMELQRSQFDENPSAKLQEYWMDGHYNGAPTTDPMYRAWTPAEVKLKGRAPGLAARAPGLAVQGYAPQCSPHKGRAARGGADRENTTGEE